MRPLKIVKVPMDEDVFAAEETKVHTFSRQVIADMLDTAERAPASTSAPPPSGVREVKQSGTMAKIAVVDYEEDDGLEPTRLSERMPVARALVAQLIDAPPVIIHRPATPAVPMNDFQGWVHFDQVNEPAAKPRADRKALAITLVTFVVTLVTGLFALQHLLTR
jgi:hypothetical protein